jgi:membrane-bound lytic murein transglycosylase D
MRFFAVALIFFGVAASYAQAPEVPHKMQFAGMTLTIRDDARREIQADVDALTRSPKHVNIKAERAKTYFPTIEKIFAEENLPDDFKYLVLQESALIPDAVSVSDAVGFWQFKDFTAMEMGMRVDKEIDERKNLVSASRGAARYLKKNNTLFDNWLYALQSYQMGAGGVQRSVGEKNYGAKNMDITKETYWYVKKFLAHKVAFEGALKGEPLVKVMDYQPGVALSTQEVAEQLSIEEAKLLEYNKWILKGNIPNDKKYVLLIPIGETGADVSKLIAASPKNQETKPVVVATTKQEKPLVPRIFINGVPAVKALQGEKLAALAARTQVKLSDLIRFNDITSDHQLIANQYYFIARKKGKGEKPFHQLAKNEDLWLVSQLYGIQLKKLRKFNRMQQEEKLLQAGTTVWLNAKMPRSNSTSPVMMADNGSAVVQISEETFDWQGNEGEPVKTEPVKMEPVKNEPAKSEPVKVSEAPVQKVPADTIKAVVAPVSVIDLIEKIGGTEKKHIVQQGETLYTIAKIYAVSVSDISRWNSLNLQQPISPGQSLKILVSEPVAKNETTVLATETTTTPSVSYYDVKSSDTLYSVARQYGVTIKELMDWNQKTDFTLSVGERLRIVQK